MYLNKVIMIWFWHNLYLRSRSHQYYTMLYKNNLHHWHVLNWVIKFWLWSTFDKKVAQDTVSPKVLFFCYFSIFLNRKIIWPDDLMTWPLYQLVKYSNDDIVLITVYLLKALPLLFQLNLGKCLPIKQKILWNQLLI